MGDDDAWWTDVPSLQQKVLQLIEEMDSLKQKTIPELEKQIISLKEENEKLKVNKQRRDLSPPPQKPLPQISQQSFIQRSISPPPQKAIPKLNDSQTSNGNLLRESSDRNAASPPPKRELTPQELRQKILDEIVETERSYLRKLRLVVSVVKEPLSQQLLKSKSQNPPPLLTQTQLEKLFSNMDEIIATSAAFLEVLERRVQKHHSIGEVFLDLAPSIKSVYTKYTETHWEALSVMDELEKKEAFNTFLLELPLEGLHLRAYLIMPCQRVPRYELLLRELIKKTDDKHEDRQNLERAMKSINEIANHINHAISLEENRKKVKEIQSRFDDLLGHTLSEPQRLFVKEGTLLKVCRKAPKPRYFCLFNDLLIYATPNPTSLTETRYILHQWINLDKCRVDSNSSESVKEPQKAFTIISQSKSFTVIADTEQERVGWLQSLTETISTYSASNSSQTLDLAPVWANDSSSDFCMLCSTSFTILKRRHHCRRCGTLVCGQCSDKKAILPNLGNEKVRVCDNCYLDNLDPETRAQEEQSVKRALNERIAKEQLLAQEKQLKKSEKDRKKLISEEKKATGKFGSLRTNQEGELNQSSQSISSQSTSSSLQYSQQLSSSVESLGDGVVSKHMTVYNPNIQRKDITFPVDESLDPKQRKKNQILNEFINTERDYVDDLTTIVEVFLKPLQVYVAAGKMTEKQFQGLFSNTETLLSLNQHFLQDIDSSLASKSFSLPASILKYADLFRMYTIYSNNHEQANLIVSEMKKDSTLKKFLDASHKKPELKSLQITDYLIKPIQRITKYPLLLRELISNTEPSTDEWNQFQNSKQVIESVLSSLNSERHARDNSDKILEIQKAMDPSGELNLLSKGRKYVQEGLLGICYSWQELKEGKVKDVYVYLFEDLMLVSRAKKALQASKPLHLIPLNLALLNSLSDDTVFASSAFELGVMGVGGRKFFFLSPNEKTRWVSKLGELIEINFNKDRSYQQPKEGIDSTGRETQVGDVYSINAKDKKKYDKLLKYVDTNRQKSISKKDAKKFLAVSGLPNSYIDYIVDLSDVDNDEKLDVQQWRVMMHLVYHALKGYELPTELPFSLLNDAEYVESNNSVPKLSQSQSQAQNLSQSLKVAPSKSVVLEKVNTSPSVLPSANKQLPPPPSRFPVPARNSSTSSLPPPPSTPSPSTPSPSPPIQRQPTPTNNAPVSSRTPLNNNVNNVNKPLPSPSLSQNNSGLNGSTRPPPQRFPTPNSSATSQQTTRPLNSSLPPVPSSQPISPSSNTGEQRPPPPQRRPLPPVRTPTPNGNGNVGNTNNGIVQQQSSLPPVPQRVPTRPTTPITSSISQQPSSVSMSQQTPNQSRPPLPPKKK